MAKIAIIDDNKEHRETNKIRLNLFLKELNSDLQVIDIFPFDKYDNYYSFIDSEDIVAIVTDEKLYNDSQLGKSPVDYNGSDLVVYIRERYKYIPVFTLTNFPSDDELLEKINEYDYIFSKNNFTKKQVEIIQRACHRYLEENKRELSDFNDLTIKVASGNADQNDLEKLKALHVKLQLPFSSLEDREEWLKEYEEQANALQQFKNKLEEKLNRK